MKFLKTIAFLALIIIGTIPFSTLSAEEATQTPSENLVKIRLLAEQGMIHPGEELWIALEQSIHPGWHTYWKNPGDSGTPPRIQWTLPEGFEISALEWPTPHKLPYGPLLNYGYENNAILLQKLKAPETIPSGPLTLKADVEILVCQEECIPEYGQYSLTLNGPESASEDNRAYFEAAQNKRPQPVTWDAVFAENDEGFFALNITPQEGVFELARADSLEFIPQDWGIIDNPAPPEITAQNGQITLLQARGDRPLNALSTVSGLLAFDDAKGVRKAVSLSARPAKAGVPRIQTQQAPQSTTDTLTSAPVNITVIHALLFAFLGGIVLNLMPCVFPILSIKALSLVKIADKHPTLARLHGLSYTAGIIVSFLLIAGTLIALKSAGASIGWGFQLQSPLVVALLAYLLFIIGLNFMGFFEIGNIFGNVGQKLTQGKGLSTSFFTGTLATLVATPCTAPFMAAAIGFAFTQPALVNLSVFAALGFGLALPYLALSFLPILQHTLPKPGAWMSVFRQALAFPMFAASIWLIWVLGQQTDQLGVFTTLMGMVGISFVIWLLHITREKKSAHPVILFILALILFAAFLPFISQSESSSPNSRLTQDTSPAENSFGEPYSAEKLENLLEGDSPVFVEMTAAWCITCKVNHAVALDTPDTRALFSEYNIRYLIGDWTNSDPEITKYLKDHGRAGVPIYVYYGPRDTQTKKRPEGTLLPQILTPGIVKHAITDKP